MEKYKAPILGLISLGVFWLLSIACSPQVGQTVECNFLPTPATKTFATSITVIDLITGDPVGNAVVTVEERNLALVKQQDNSCKVTVINTSQSQKVTGSDGKATFTVIEKKNSPDDYVAVFIQVTKQGYNEGTWSFSTHTNESQAVVKNIYLTPKEVYP